LKFSAISCSSYCMHSTFNCELAVASSEKSVRYNMYYVKELWGGLLRNSDSVKVEIFTQNTEKSVR